LFTTERNFNTRITSQAEISRFWAEKRKEGLRKSGKVGMDKRGNEQKVFPGRGKSRKDEKERKVKEME